MRGEPKMVEKTDVVLTETKEDFRRFRGITRSSKIRRELLGRDPYHCKHNEHILIDGDGVMWIMRK